jgi:hypothetical protein
MPGGIHEGDRAADRMAEELPGSVDAIGELAPVVDV